MTGGVCQLQKNKELSPRNTRHEYLLRGHVYCSRCGRSYGGGTSSSKRGDKVYERQVYRCTGRSKITAPVRCDNKGHSTRKLDGLVWEQVERLLAQPDVVITDLMKRQEEANEIPAFQEEIGIIDSRLGDLNKEQLRLLQWALKDSRRSWSMGKIK